jgi:hypothetical protein
MNNKKNAMINETVMASSIDIMNCAETNGTHEITIMILPEEDRTLIDNDLHRYVQALLLEDKSVEWNLTGPLLIWKTVDVG